MTGVPGHEPSGPADGPGHEPSGPADGPGPGRSGPPGSRGGPDGGFGDDLADDWGLDLGREPPSEEELHGVVFDPGNSPVEGWEVMSDAQRRELLGGDLYPGQDGEDGAAEALEAGFTHRHGGTGAGFAAGGPLDVMLPGPGLAWHVGAARQRGLGALSDDELIGAAGRGPEAGRPGRPGWNWPRWPSWTPAAPGRAAARASTWPRNSLPR